MNVKRMRTFMLVVQHKSFSTVADILKISQPAVSKQIKALEKDLGVLLLYRDTLNVTEAGRMVLHKGKKFLDTWEEMLADSKIYHGELTGLLQIGASSIPGTYLIPQVLRRFLDMYPRMEVRLSVVESDEVLRGVQDERFDIGFMGSQPDEEGLVIKPFAKDHLFVIGPPNDEEVEDINELLERPFIFRSDRSGTWQAVQKALIDLGHSENELKCVAKVEHTESVISLVEAGLGYSIISDFAALRAKAHERINILFELPISRSFYAIHLVAKRHSKPVAALVTMLEE